MAEDEYIDVLNGTVEIIGTNKVRCWEEVYCDGLIKWSFDTECTVIGQLSGPGTK